MITHRFLVLCMTFLFCVAAVSSTLAQENLPAIVKKIGPSVVVILNYDKEGKTLTQGSGFFINEKGDVITNRHVLQGASRAEVKTADGKIYPVKKVLAEDREGDLIWISAEIPRSAVRPLPVSRSLPEVGERVIVIGSPLGFERTVSDGIVSAVREIPAFGKIIQISAPLSPDSSGSPVANMKGEVIGVATFQMVERQNLNFALPGQRVLGLKAGKGQTLAQWQAGRKEEWLTSAEELYSTGLAFLWAEDYEKALPYFEKAVEKDPRYAEAYFQIGYCNSSLGRYNEAIEAYKQAIHIKPDFAEAYCNLGVAYGHLKRYEEAIEAYKQVIRIKPDFADAHYNLGLIYLVFGDRGSALQDYKILKDLDENLANKLFNLIYK